MYCSKCGTPNDDTARFCSKCGTPLGVAPATGSTVSPPPVDPRVRGGPNMPVAPGALHPTGPGAVQHAAAGGTGKEPWLAALLSFLIPGVGQFYNNDPKKGAIMLGGAVLLAITIIGYVGIMVWSVIDAYQVASGSSKTW